MSQTRDNIKRKRRKRLVRQIFFLFRVLLFAVAFIALSWALVQALIRSAAVYGEYHAMYEAFRERKESGRTPLDQKFDGYVNLLVFGLDDGMEDGVRRADTIIFVSHDGATGAIRALSLPRGTWVKDASGSGAKLGDVFGSGGVGEAMEAVHRLLGVSIHYYAVIGTKTLAKMIDAMGGVDIYVETRMDYDDPDGKLAIHIPQGYQRMSGDDAQKYLRYRSGELGDIGRMQRQHRFIKSLYERARQIEALAGLPAIARILQEEVDTSVEVWDSARLAEAFQSLPEAAPMTMMLPGAPWQGDESVYFPDEARIREKMKEFFHDGDKDEEEG